MEHHGSDARLLGHKWALVVRTPAGKRRIAEPGMFDELVVDDWLHVEWLDERVWWMRLGDARIQVEICDDGIAKVDIVRGFYEPVRGESSTTQEPAAT